MWKALVQRRYSETAGALALSLIYVVARSSSSPSPDKTIGSASQWANQMSEAFLSISDHGEPSGGGQAKDAAANQLFDLLVFKPWAVLEFGGLEHCALADSVEGDGDPESVAVRPLSSSPTREAELARRLAKGTEVSADGKVCANNANKYGSHFLRFGPGTDERDAEYEALDAADTSKLPEADSARAGYRLGAVDKPATDAMEKGGQYQRLLIAIVVFLGELGAFLLLGSLSIGVILAQILLLLMLAFAPVALVAAVIPGRGHDFFKRWLEKLDRLPTAKGCLLADPGGAAGGQRRARDCHLAARLADVLRDAGGSSSGRSSCSGNPYLRDWSGSRPGRGRRGGTGRCGSWRSTQGRGWRHVRFAAARRGAGAVLSAPGRLLDRRRGATPSAGAMAPARQPPAWAPATAPRLGAGSRPSMRPAPTERSEPLER